MAAETAHGQAHEPAGMRVMYWVWIWLLAVTLLEVLLAYLQVPPHIMLVALMGMSLVKASLIVAYFMHLKFERLNLVLTVIPATVGAILLLNVFFPDSTRLGQLAIFR
jgi:cytochrome c oxidase subunit 4